MVDRSEYTITTTEVSRRLRVSDDTIKRACARGEIAYVLTPGGHYRFRLADIEAWAESLNREVWG